MSPFSSGLTLCSEDSRTLRDRPEARDPVRMRYGGLMLLPEGPRILRNCLEGPWSLGECPAQLVGTYWNLSGLVATCRNSRGLEGSTLSVPWVPIPKELQAYCLQAASIRPAGCFHQAGGTAEGVGGYLILRCQC